MNSMSEYCESDDLERTGFFRSTGGIYVFVRIYGEGLLAYVLPTPEGGTELVYLAGDHQDRLVLGGDGTNYVIEDLGGRSGAPRERAAELADADSRG
jgi:hypothetical protein